jgi:hypothetical protein
MANAKKSSKKSVAKKPKSVSVRATKKTVTKKAPVKTTVQETTLKPKVKKSRSPMDVINDFMRGSVLIYAALAVAVVAFVTSAASKITLTVQAPDLLTDSSGKVLAPATEVLFNLTPQYWLSAMFGLSALGSLLLATRFRAKYRAGIDNKTSGLRWIVIGLTAGLSLQFVSLLAGVSDLAVLKMTAGLILATALLGWLSERENSVANSPKWLAYVSSLITGFIAWLAILGSLIGTFIYGKENFAWHVYAISAVVLLGFIGFAVVQYRHIKGRSASFLAVEQNYWRVDFLYKLVLAAIVIAAL